MMKEMHVLPGCERSAELLPLTQRREKLTQSCNFSSSYLEKKKKLNCVPLNSVWWLSDVR